MAKISKNIKRLRTVNSLTQQDLAERLHVTRQTVSSWETDRTQPDIEILQSLAAVFGVELEELIYGKKHKKDGEEKPSYNSTVIVILSIIGCLLIAVGVILVLVNFWENVPSIVKLFLCFVPLLAGQGFGIFTYFKKRESAPWCEGSSVLWIAGVMATTFMLEGNASYIGIQNLSLFYIFLAFIFFGILPILKSFLPVITYFVYIFFAFERMYAEIDYSYYKLDNDFLDYLSLAGVTALLAAFTVFGLWFSKRYFKKEDNIVRYTFYDWIRFFVISLYLSLPIIMFDSFIPKIITFVIFVYLLIGEKQENRFSPFKLLSLPLSVVLMCYFAIGIYSGSSGKPAEIALPLILSALSVVLLLNKKLRPKEKFMLFYSVLLCFSAVSYAVADFLLRNGGEIVAETIFSLLGMITFVCVIGAFVCLIIYGAKRRRLYYINLGFTGVCAVVIIKLIWISLDPVSTGVLLIACGTVLLLINLKISRLKKKEEEALLSTENDGEVQ